MRHTTQVHAQGHQPVILSNPSPDVLAAWRTLGAHIETVPTGLL
jgi:hypothetical protein